MRVLSVVKVVLLAAAVALPAGFSAASAKEMKLPPGACLFDKKAAANGTICSFSCDPKLMWCRQQLCVNGTLVAVLPCYSPFCTAKCGG